MNKILIANRGEIACRIIRTARSMGYRTVAVFSEADAGAAHVSLADEAICIGAPAPDASYLNIDALLHAAARTGADAIHPGYGFLSERADFAQACIDQGLTFIGPLPHSIAAMGNKALAKQRMTAANVPCVPGYQGEQQDDETLMVQAQTVGFPLLIKAVAGGGGRGMRVVRSIAEMPQALSSARREAESAFGDGTVMLERLISRGRHIEIQIFADCHGNVVHLGERDCTTQRRHQKVIEEAPSPLVNESLRAAMGRDAILAAQSVAYVGAGTVEFIVDAERRHYFLEMNTRLQVEHPVTEAITGLDLVEWQLRVAAGETLPLQQDQIVFRGHAIEARLYAENPYQHFQPQTGQIVWWRPEAVTPNSTRIDAGMHEGGIVSPWYDGMLAKFIVHGKDRGEALRRLHAALEDTPLLGPVTNAQFLCALLKHPDFVQSRLHTATLDEWQAQGDIIFQPPEPRTSDWLMAAGLLLLWNAQADADSRPESIHDFDFVLEHADQQQRMRVSIKGKHAALSWNGQTHDFNVISVDRDGRFKVELDGIQRQVVAASKGRQLLLAVDSAVLAFTEHSPYPQTTTKRDHSRALAPLAGAVGQIRVNVGDTVAAGQQMLCIDAMKMQLWVVAGMAGTIKAIHVQTSQSVTADSLLLELEPLS